MSREEGTGLEPAIHDLADRRFVLRFLVRRLWEWSGLSPDSSRAPEDIGNPGWGGGGLIGLQRQRGGGRRRRSAQEHLILDLRRPHDRPRIACFRGSSLCGQKIGCDLLPSRRNNG